MFQSLQGTIPTPANFFRMFPSRHVSIPSRYDPNVGNAEGIRVVEAGFNPFKVRSQRDQIVNDFRYSFRVSIPSRYDPNTVGDGERKTTYLFQSLQGTIPTHPQPPHPTCSPQFQSLQGTIPTRSYVRFCIVGAKVSIPSRYDPNRRRLDWVYVRGNGFNPFKVRSQPLAIASSGVAHFSFQSLQGTIPTRLRAAC